VHGETLESLQFERHQFKLEHGISFLIANLSAILVIPSSAIHRLNAEFTKKVAKMQIAADSLPRARI